MGRANVGVSTSYLQFIGTVLIDQDQDGHTHMPFIALVLAFGSALWLCTFKALQFEPDMMDVMQISDLS